MSDAEELRRGPVAGLIRRHRLVCILRRVEPATRLLELVDGLADAGARIFEVTWDTPSAAVDLAALRGRLAASRTDGPFLVGAGTLLRREHVTAAMDAGADFGVSPILDLGLVAAAVEMGLPFVPGAMTPSEVSAGWAAGATFVKVFPASAVGPAFVRELHNPLREIELIPTGGVDATNARDFLDAGAAAVGIGSALVRADGAGRRELVSLVAGTA